MSHALQRISATSLLSALRNPVYSDNASHVLRAVWCVVTPMAFMVYSQGFEGFRLDLQVTILQSYSPCLLEM